MSDDLYDIKLTGHELVALSILVTPFDRVTESAAEMLLPKDFAQAHNAVLADITKAGLFGHLLKSARKIQAGYEEYEKAMEDDR